MTPLPAALAANIEIKARVDSLDQIRPLADQVATSFGGILEQCDTFFHCSQGRLKLRETVGAATQLIWYVRPDEPTARKSQYSLVACGDDGTALKQALAAALGIQVTVRKRRELYFHHHVRIHLDRVQGLGDFIELEAVLAADRDEAAEQRRVAELLQALRIDESAYQSEAYAQLLTKT